MKNGNLLQILFLLLATSPSVIALPDLTLTDIKYQPGNYPGSPWDFPDGTGYVDVALNVTNLGDATSERVFVTVKSNTLEAPIDVGILARGETKKVALPLPANKSSSDFVELGATNINSFYVTAEVDEMKQIAESNENNNKKALEVGSSPRSCTDSDGGINYRERGFTTGDGWSSKDGCNDANTLVEYSCGRADIVVTTYSCQGDCVLGACASAPLIETPSTTPKPGRNTTRPDMKKKADLVPVIKLETEKRLSSDKSFNIKIKIKNIGTKVAEAQVSSYQINGKTYTFKLAAIRPGFSRSKEFTIRHLPAGKYIIKAIADSNGKVSELNEDNNVASLEVKIQKPSRSVDPDDDDDDYKNDDKIGSLY